MTWPSEMSRTASHCSASPTYWVVTRSVRSLVTEAAQLAPDRRPQERVDPGGGLVEDRTAGSWTSAVASSRRRCIPRTTCRRGGRARTKGRRARGPGGSATTSPPQQPEQRRHEVDVLAGGEVWIQRELLRHVADAFTGLAA
jgi:hypothetical protein